ncbi:MAG: Ig-like domain-containing protein, partial [Lachnospiraceae bacterium]|nr:Ig-like domain-containing protein [Lachnospiraceae bacterium]
TIALSDCGSILVLATENNTKAGPSVSENNIILGENPENGELCSDDDVDIRDTDISIDDNASESNPELPALHIGQIKKGEALPSPDDDKFVYDLPISMDASNHLLLFVNYNLNTLPEKEDGTLVWSILRGEKGVTPGSTSLVQEDDDWTDFETVSSSPYFTLTENKDKESDHYNTAELALKDTVTQEIYDYFIRAAYYPEAENTESFYAAVTVPFLPLHTDTAEMQDDTSTKEETLSNSISDNTIAMEDTAQEEMQNKAAVDAASDDIDAKDADLPEEDSFLEQTPESVSENSEAAQTAAPLSALYEDEDQSDSVSQSTKNSVGVLTLSKENVTLHPAETLSVSATVLPKSITEPISWESADQAIATVDKNGNITAAAKGITQIIAKCGDMTAIVKVNVVETDENEVYDLSRDIWIAGFQKENEALVYTGQKVTQNFRVYYKETLLKEKTDYTLSYKNNVNAAAWNAVKAPSVTITMKGQYQGSVTLYYTIYPADIRTLDIYHPAKENSDENKDEEAASAGYKQTVNYSKTLKIPDPALTLGKKKLSVGKDFVCDYTTLLAELEQKNYKKGDSYELGKVYHYTVNGKGNFTGSIPMQLVVVKNKNFNFSSASVTLSANQYEYHGTELSKTDVTIKQIKFNKLSLEETLYDYDVYATQIDGAHLIVYPTAAGEEAGYFGFKKVALKLVGDRNIKDASLGKDWKTEITFSQKAVNEAGGLFQETEGVLTFGEEET